MIAVRRALRTIVAVAMASLPIAACSPARDEPGAVTADEARQLNDAAAMLDANSVDQQALPNNGQDRP